MAQPYHSLEAAWHDAFWAADDDASELPLMRGFLARHPGPALEIGCGSGRLMLPLLDEGFTIEGLELSDDMLELARGKAISAGLEAVFHGGDMEVWHPPYRYNAVLAPAFTLQLAADPAPVLRHWHNWLKPGGGLYLTTFMPYAELLGELPENTWYPDHQAQLDDGRCVEIHTRHTIDRARRQIRREHRYLIEGESGIAYQSSQRIRWIEHDEMLTMLNHAGFTLNGCAFDFERATHASPPAADEFDGILTYFARRADNPDEKFP